MRHEPPAYFAGIMEDDGRPRADLVAEYRDGPALLRRAVADMDARQLRERPVAGKMSTLEVLGHVADCEQFLADRIKRTASTDLPLLVGVDGPATWRPWPTRSATPNCSSGSWRSPASSWRPTSTVSLRTPGRARESTPRSGS